MNKKILLTSIVLLSLISTCFAETIQTNNDKMQVQVSNPNTIATKANKKKSLQYPPQPKIMILVPINNQEGCYAKQMIQGPIGIYYDPEEQIKINKEYAQKQGEDE